MPDHLVLVLLLVCWWTGKLISFCHPYLDESGRRHFWRVSLKHDGTAKMADLPVPSLWDRRDRQTTVKTWRDRLDSGNGQSAWPVIVWQMGQALNEKRKAKSKSVLLWMSEWMNEFFSLTCDKKLGLTKSQFSPTHVSTKRKITDELKHNAGWYEVREGSPVEVQWTVRWVGGWSMVGRICGTGEF